MIGQDDVLYMIVTDRFADGDPSNNAGVDRTSPAKRHGGDLLGIVRRMPYLRDLGVSTLWITPVYVNPPDGYHGYHPIDFERVDPHLCSAPLGASGDRRTIRRFVEIAHEHGLKVMLDIIVCHTGQGHPWLESRPHWFYAQESNTPETRWSWGLPHLNHDDVNVNIYFARNVLDWITLTDVDAIRIDAARHVQKHFWPIFKLFGKGLHPEVTVVGEVWDRSPSVVAPYQAYHGFDSMFDYPLYEAIVDVFARDQGFGRLARPELSDDEPRGVLNEDCAYRNPCHLVTFVGNHDNPRFFDLAGGNVDQPGATARMKLALCFLFATRGIPQLYYGDELRMGGGPHRDNRRDMPWSLVDEQPARSEDETAADMRRVVQKLVQLRRFSKALRYGMLTTLYLTPTCYAFARTFLDDIRIVVLNNSRTPVDAVIPIHENSRLPLLARQQLPNGMVLVDGLNTGNSARIEQGHVRVTLSGRSAAIFRPDEDDNRRIAAAPQPPARLGSRGRR
jgi:glycosidase